MKANSNSILIDNYFGLLNSLSNEYKRQLITKLSNSIYETPTQKTNDVDRFYGAFLSNNTAEELINDIKLNRTFNRIIESF